MAAREESGEASSTAGEGETSTTTKLMKIKHSINLDLCKYPIVQEVVNDLGWKTVEQGSAAWEVYWTDQSVSNERVMQLKRCQKLNHFPGMAELYRKCKLGTNMNRMARLCPEQYQSIIPETFVLPAERRAFEARCGSLERSSSSSSLKAGGGTAAAATEESDEKKPAKKTARTFIIKPDDGACGEGIFLTRKPTQVPPTLACVAQRYIPLPLLVDERKFDLRIYVLVTSITPLRIYLYEEGIARFATEAYCKPTTSTLQSKFQHLTNFSVNKKSEAYVQNEAGVQEDAENEGSGAAARSIGYIRKWLRENGHDEVAVWEKVKDVVRKTLISVLPHLVHVYKSCLPEARDNVGFSCFDLMGFDVLLTKKVSPILIEVNEMPSFDVPSPLHHELKHGLITEALRIISTSKAEKERLKAFSSRTSPPGEREALVAMRIQHENQRKKRFTLIYPLEEEGEAARMYRELERISAAAWAEKASGRRI